MADFDLGVGTISMVPQYLTATLVYPWPDGFPMAPAKSSYQELRRGQITQFKPDVGPTRIRPKYTYSPVILSVTYRVTMSQVNDFDYWFRSVMLSGLEEFVYLHPRKQVPMNARIVGAPMYAPIGGDLWEVTLQIEERPD